MKITIGEHQNKSVKLDLDILMRTRLLIQADSGGGKSWLLRRLAEQLFGKVQVILIDPEGEFATLREKFGYVLVGRGGETAADPRSAALVAHRLLELRASAICDIYELKHQQRYAWVRMFLEALTDIPKKLWGRQVVVIVDEAHMFCPEKGKGKSEAYGAMVDLCTRGRKRGHCAIFATQRLGQLSKDASSQLQNRLIGPTFEDINRKRASEVLGVLKAEEREFFKEIQLLEPGHFFALGRAISTERILVSVGPVETTHPEMGSAKQSADPPPAPEKIKELLPKLADLPKEAEEKQKTVQALQMEVRELKRQLRDRPAAAIMAVDKEHLEKEAKRMRIELEKQVKDYVRTLQDFVFDHLNEVKKSISTNLSGFKLPDPPKLEYANVIASAKPMQKLTQKVTAKPAIDVSTIDPGDTKLGRCERKILSFLASNEKRQWSQVQVAIMTKYTVGGGGFGNALGRLNSLGLISRENGMVSLLALPGGFTPEEIEYSIEGIKEIVARCEREIIRVMLDNPHAKIPLDELASQCIQANGQPYSAGGGGFGNAVGKLASLGFLTRTSGVVELSDDAKELL